MASDRNVDSLSRLKGSVVDAVRHRRFADAEAWLRAALHDAPDSADLLFLLGTVLAEGGKLEPAVQCFERLHHVLPGNLSVLNNLGNALRHLGRVDEAVHYLRQAVALQPAAADVLVNLGYALCAGGALDEAVQCGRTALGHEPHDTGAHVLVATALAAAGRHKDAIAELREAVTTVPDDPALHVQLALLLLATGNITEGAVEYEWRWRGYHGAKLPSISAPLWDGRPLEADKTLLLLAEGSVGDIVQFVRYAVPLHARVGRIVLHCPASVAPLLAGVAGLDAIVPFGAPVAAVDAWLPLSSAMHRLDTTLATIPAEIPYLQADAARATALAATIGKGFTVGVALGSHDSRRSPAPDLLKPLLDVAGVRFVALQPGLGAALRAVGADAAIVDLAPEISGLVDLAAAISRLDLVITADETVAHLAGALGRSAWMLLPANPDWRWLLGRADSPWYPSLLLFRQARPGAWQPVVEELVSALTIFGVADGAIEPADHSAGEEDRGEEPPAMPPPDAAALAALKETVATATRQRRFADAEQLLRDALDRHQGDHELGFLLGTVLAQAGRPEAAIEVFERVLADLPDNFNLLNNLGNALRVAGRGAEAVPRLRRALALQPNSVEVLLNLGHALRDSGQAADAVHFYRRALAMQPDHLEALYYLARACETLGELGDAETAFRHVMAQRPNATDVLSRLAMVLARQGRRDEAASLLQQVLQKEPGNASVLNELGLVERGRGRLDEAAALFRRALAARPAFGQALNNLGLTLNDQGHGAAAIAAFREALALAPDDAALHRNLGRTLLAVGDLPAGSAEYEWRLRLPPQKEPPGIAAPIWDGRVLGADKVLLLRTEQSLGEAIQFVRYAPLLRPFAGRIVLRCPAPLVRLLATADGLDEVVPEDAALPAVDAQVPLASLMHRLGTRLETIPAAIPYLAADPARVAALAPAIAGDGRKIGLVWAAESDEIGEPGRALPLAALKPFLDAPSTRFYSLQTGPRAAELRDRPLADRIVDLSPFLADLADTAAAIAQLDLVVTVDASVAHLAGALGRPAWVMLQAGADWRWLQRRADSPWYPSLRLFRQTTQGDWTPVIAAIGGALAELPAPAATPVPVSPRALNDRGTRLAAEGRYADAISCFERAVGIRPDYVDALSNLGNALAEQGRLDEAAIQHARAVALQPENADLVCNLGATFLRLGRTPEAATCFERALGLAPDHAAALNNLGSVRRAENRLGEAADLYRRAASLPRPKAEIFRNLGDVLRLDGQLDGAEAAYRRALALDPGFVDVLNGLAIVLKDLDRLDEAAACCRRALDLRPDFPEALINLGNVLCAGGDHAGGIARFRRAVALQPDLAAAHLNLAIALLTLGDFRDGAAEYEWRSKVHETPPLSEAPLWDGRPLRDGTLLLVAEQGLGDTIQFARYAALLRPVVGRLALHCPATLKPLLATMPAFDQVIAEGEPMPPADAQAPLLSLMHLLDTELETIPAEIPYLAAAPDRVAALAPHLAGDEFKVGLVWGGNPKHPYDRHRSVPLATLQPLLDVPGTRFFSLQLGPRRAELNADFARRIVDLSPHLGDFADTAAALSQLDLVIAVDTAVAHLAGALGRPTWMMVPANADWRWLLHRGDSPWYPSLRLFRQSARGDWTPIVERLLPALLERVAAREPRARPETLNNLGLRLRRLGRHAAAVDCFRRALDARPNYPLAQNNLGLALQDQGKIEDAIAAHRRAIALKPHYADGHNNLAVALDRADRSDEAIAHYRQALALQPDHPEALTNYGNALRLAGRLDEAIAAQRRSLELRPDQPDALNNLGFSLKTKGNLGAAIDCFRRAIAAQPDFVSGHMNLALALLTQGDFAEGLEEYEWRWRGYQGARLPDLGQKLWDGTPLGDERTLLLLAEQGLGDTIQFIRYAPLLRGYAGRIVLSCQPALTGVMATAPGLDAVVPAGGALPPFDAFVPLMSLMHRLGTRLETIPAAVPYLAADTERVAALAPRFRGAGLKVGLVWSGNPKHGNDRHRSVPLSLLRPLLTVPGTRLFSLQVGARAQDIAAEGLAGLVTDLSPGLADFADTAAAISHLDLVVTVDTSVAHLAGALGRPTWLLLPWNADWRWLADRTDSPWYASMMLFRQPRYGAWEPVIEQVVAALAAGTRREGDAPFGESVVSESTGHRRAAATAAGKPRPR